MVIVELIEDIIRENLGEDTVNLLKFYEATYPPDWGLEVIQGGGGVMDFATVGGDIATVGFWYNANLDSILALANQDLTLRLLINDTMSKFISNFGIGPIEDIPRDTLEAAVALAATNSPYIAQVRNITIVDGDSDTVDIRIEAVTVTGDAIGFAFNI